MKKDTSMTNTKLSFKNTALSVVIVSAMTGGLIAIENYSSEENSHSTATSEKNSYQVSDIHRGEIYNVLATTDANEQALIAEANLISQIITTENEEPQIYYEQEFSTVRAQQLNIDLFKQDKLIKQQQVELVLEDEVLFSFDSAKINPAFYTSLMETAAYIKESVLHSETVWQIVGHTDKIGSDRYNQVLANRRAQSVADFLVDNGVLQEQLSVISLGSSDPLFTEVNEENNQSNRRVEIHEYQAEVMVLVEQLNQQLKGQSILQKKLSNPQLKALPKQQIEPVEVANQKENKTYQQQLDKQVESYGGSPINFEFEEPQILNITLSNTEF